MSTAHVCLRSALTQAFRPSTFGIAASYSVASFLVPAVTHPARRTFSATRRSKKAQTTLWTKSEDEQDRVIYEFPPKPITDRPTSCIQFPPHDDRGDIQQWLAAIDPFLPTPLRRKPTNHPEKSPTVTSVDLSLFLIAAQASKLDVLSHLGLVEGRWPTVVWIAKKLVEDGRRSIEPPNQLEPFVNVRWPELESRSLKDLTSSPLRLESVRPARKLKLRLNDLTSAPDYINSHHVVAKRALGQLWRSLGYMILAATERSHDDIKVMPYVLEIIAHLHHLGFIPDSVYSYKPHDHRYALQQPPTLHILSSQILTALSDATWKAHEASVKSAKQGSKASYFLGHEIPGSRYRTIVSEVAPELWLELVLWSSLHGGWIQDGAAILEQMAKKQGEQIWGLISWREIMQAEQQNSPAASRGWKLFPVKADVAPSAQDRARTRRTISSEVVTAFIDAIVGEMRLGVGNRGTAPEVLLEQIKMLKRFLDANNLSLGSISWDSIMARLLESGGLGATMRPEILLRIFELAAGFGAEVSSANTSTMITADVPYFFEPTALSLNLLHQAIRAYIGNGDLNGAMAAFKILQRYTDENKQKSLHEFFEMLKTATPSKDKPFTSGLPPVNYPAFDTNLPIPLRAKLLDLATESKEYELGRWFLFAQDLDGPLIGRDLYRHRNVASSIVRFGTLAGENDLVVDIVEKVGAFNEEHQKQRMPAEILTALLCSQIQLRRWGSVRSMQQYVVEESTFRPRPIILATFAAEILRTSQGPQDEMRQAQGAFAGLLFSWEDLLFSRLRNELYCILSIMSTVDTEWQRYCSRFLAMSFRQEIRLSTSDFNKVLDGVLDAYGSTKGQQVVAAWCYQTHGSFEPYRAPGGLEKMPHYWTGKADEHRQRPDSIELVQESGATVTLQGRVRPNRQTIWAIIRKVKQELDEGRSSNQGLSATDYAGIRDVVKWAAKMLHSMGSDYEDIQRDLGTRLVELAKLEAPSFRDNTVLDSADLGH